MVQDGFVCWQFHLFIRGQWVSTAIGEHPDPGNQRMSLANRAEAAKSDALVKCCKALGIGRELWEPNYRNDWMQRNAIRVWALQNEWSTKGRWLWRRKDRPPFYKEAPPKRLEESEYKSAETADRMAESHLSAIQEEEY
jgi:hypothetical protein